MLITVDITVQDDDIRRCGEGARNRAVLQDVARDHLGKAALSWYRDFDVIVRAARPAPIRPSA